MELKLTHETICINEVMFDGTLEQSVELDYLLPDYFPNIFKVLKCRIIPKIVSKSISGDKLVIDGIAYIKVMYAAEETNEIKLAEQKLPFTKTADLKDTLRNPQITAVIRTDYVNCRVVNSRRIDVRGAVSCKVSVWELRNEEIVTDADGMGAQLQKQAIFTDCEHLHVYKQFSVHEDLEQSGTFASAEVLNTTFHASAADHRVIANKIVAKGEIALRVLCSLESGNPPMIMEHTIPISQIVDLPGIDEGYDCIVKFDVISADLDFKPGENDSAAVGADFSVIVNCEAFKSREMQTITDMFSTSCESALDTKKIRLQKLMGSFNQLCHSKETLELDKQFTEIYEVCCETKNTSFVFEEDGPAVNCELDLSILCRDESNMPMMVDRSVGVKFKIDTDIASECDLSINGLAQAAEIGFTVVGDNKVEVRTAVRVCGEIFRSCMIDAVIGINIDQNRPKSRDNTNALTIYYADRGERVWDVAKRYNTSPAAILEENSLEAENLNDREMLLIPIIN